MNNSYKGKILISTPDISGDIFSRSVVLIIEHDAHGAFGFILTQITQLKFFEISLWGNPKFRRTIFCVFW